MNQPIARQSPLRINLAIVAGFCMIAAGLIHVAIAPVHWSHSQFHAGFLALSGLAEVVWGVAYWHRQSPALSRIGIVLSGGLITLYIITRLLPAPFSHEPEEVDALDLVCKLAEAVGLIALVTMLTVSLPRDTAIKRAAWPTVAVLMGVALAAGWGTYGLARTVDPLVIRSDKAEAASIRSATPDNVELVVGGVPTRWANGSDVEVTKDLVATVNLQPSDGGRYQRSVDIFLHGPGGSAQSIENATVRATGHMRYMDHGTFHQVALMIGGGHYLLSLPFVMPGEWQVDVDMQSPMSKGTVQFDIDIFE